VRDMADMQLREKLKKLAEATKQEDSVSERSKNAGLIVFLILFGIGIIVLFTLTIGLVMNGHAISAIVIFIIATLFTYSAIKMMTADKIRQL
jgi:uncharacterized membrane protein